MKNTKDVDYKSIGKTIRSLRLSQNMTQEHLAELMDLSLSHIRNIESYNARISLNTLVKFANIFEVSTDYILHDSLEEREKQVDYLYTGILKDCDNNQLKIIIETMKTLKEELKRFT